MLNFVKTISSRIVSDKRFIKFLRYGKHDVQESVQTSPFGVDSNPLEDFIALYAPTGEKGETTIIGYLNKNQLADIGENRIFSLQENGDLSTFIWLKNDETMEIGGDTDFMVRYSELESAFNELKSDFNTFINSVYNVHVHSGVTPGMGSTAVTPSLGSPSSADISGAKIEEIKTI